MTRRLLAILLLTALPLWAGNRETIVPQGYTPGLTLPQAAVAQPVATLVTVMLTPGQSNLVAAGWWYSLDLASMSSGVKFELFPLKLD
jgi:hypothetical protein